jgi:cytidylate kinase
VAVSIVTVSQTLGSLGDEIGRDLARSLSYQFADREIILEAAERFGEGVPALEHATEEKPTLWERFAGTRDPYLAYVEAIVWELAARDNVVIVGRGALFSLASVRHALRVRITAPEGFRAKRVENQQGLTHEAAPGVVRQSDRDRAARIKFLYEVDWDSPLLYDLVLNTERVAVTDAVRILHEALRGDRYQPTADSLGEVKDRSITARAKAALLAHPATRDLQLTPICRDRQLSISGRVEREDLRQVAEEVVGGIPGVTGVLNEIVVLPPRVISPGV